LGQSCNAGDHPYRLEEGVFNSLFKTIYFVEYLIIAIVRSRFTARYRMQPVQIERGSLLDRLLLGMVGIGMFVPLIYVLTPWLDFADYHLPSASGWLGCLLFIVAIWLLWRSHADLGHWWTPMPALRQDHRLVTDGIYAHIRHPMYAAHFVWAIAQMLMLHNWIAGFSLLVTILPQYLIRVGAEERLMLDHFGEAYRDYMAHTGRLFPRF
jgi:protein-S-isoprenylcysteine O-methyltransferase Ste14